MTMLYFNLLHYRVISMRTQSIVGFVFSKFVKKNLHLSSLCYFPVHKHCLTSSGSTTTDMWSVVLK